MMIISNCFVIATCHVWFTGARVQSSMLGFGDNINNASDLVVARVTMVSSNISTSLITFR